MKNVGAGAIGRVVSAWSKRKITDEGVHATVSFPTMSHFIVLCIFVFVCGVGCARPSSTVKASTKSTSETERAPMKVSPITPIRKTLVRMVEQPGQVEAFEEAPLFAKVTGYVQKLNVDLGDPVIGPKYDEAAKMVSPGQVLCELDIPELFDEHAQKLALVEQADANVIQAQAAIEVAEAILASSQAKVAELEAVAEKDQANYDRWKSEAKRVADLAKSGSVGQKVSDETENQFRAADAERRETAAKVRSANALILESKALVDKAIADRQVAVSRTKVAKADADRTKTMLDYGQIHAPFDGRIAARNIHIGHLVRASVSNRELPMLVVVRIDKVRVVVEVPETDAVLIRDGSDATVRIPSLPGTRFPGQISRSGWSLDSGTRTLRVEIDVENTTGTLRQGMFVTSELKAAVSENVLSLPRAAILVQDKGTFCHAIDTTGKVQLVPVQLGIQSGNEVEIQQGLTGNEQIIGANSAAFKPGQTVEIAVPAK